MNQFHRANFLHFLLCRQKNTQACTGDVFQTLHIQNQSLGIANFLINGFIQRGTEETIIELKGRLDTTTAPVLDKTINDDIGDTKNLVLDVKGLEYISSAGLRVLLSAQKKMQKIGSMKVTNVCEEVMEVFEMTGFADILVIE